jgi:DnaJ-class molecular chaperone
MSEAGKVVERPARVPCPECLGKGWIALWPPGEPRRASQARCEQCSGFGRV